MKKVEIDENDELWPLFREIDKMKAELRQKDLLKIIKSNELESDEVLLVWNVEGIRQHIRVRVGTFHINELFVEGEEIALYGEISRITPNLQF